jgi:hypothetical protein
MREHIHEVNRDEAFGHCHFRPVADASQVVRVAKRHDAGAMALGALDGHLHRFEAHGLPVARAAVKRKQRPEIERRTRVLVRGEPALEQSVDVARNHADAVRIVAKEIRHDQVLGHELGFLRLAAAGRDDGLDCARERLFSEYLVHQSGLMPPRPTVSDGPPGTNGMTILIGLAEKPCAHATLLTAAATSAAQMTRSFMFRSLKEEGGSLD